MGHTNPSIGEAAWGADLNTALDAIQSDATAAAAAASAHSTRTDNPHATTAAQTGAITQTAADSRYDASGAASTVQTNLNAHTSSGSAHTPGNVGAVALSLGTTKGDILVCTASGVWARLPKGTDGQALVADSTQTTGLKYLTITGGGGGGTGTSELVYLDDFTGGTDEARLTSAMSYAAAQTHPPTIMLKNNTYSFTTTRVLYDGFRISGPPGTGNPEKGDAFMSAKVNVTVPGGTWLVADPGAGNATWDTYVGNLNFVGGSTTQFIGHTSGNGLYQALLRDLSFTSFKSVIGSQATKLLMTACTFDGSWEVNNSYNGAIHVGGSDCTFSWDLLLDSGTAFLAAGSANGQAHLWLDFLEKSTFAGRMYITAEGGWTGIRIDGPATYNGSVVTNLGGPLNFFGPIVEGRNKDAPADGAVVRVKGGQAIFHGGSFNFAMETPSNLSGVQSPTPAAAIHVVGGSCTLIAPQYDRATTVAESVNFAQVDTGARLRVKDVAVGTKGGTWTGLPRVKDNGGTLLVDDSVTPV